ncbi:SWIM zinc finger family protein [Bradyrhizobium sp. CB82]|uniref:SWIM zinc finger family protein n=1 Tax=Bradyrhizobium sp. CB82 TaxID=3039159 RepID=UPI0024B0BFE7|nr:SWIM zinc finger family protein [Bradyrhizobium sp. CB82]WFU42037.1 SWIM zinc finger family protein [Bradyrhizobium sp. CB82]
MAEKRRLAERELAKLRKRGQSIAPVTIEGRTIAKTFWGKSWCINLERYSDYASRVPRGRTYVRNGSVLDLKIARGEVAAMVAGSSLYKVRIAIAPVKATCWKAICRDCGGAIDSLVELLQGRLAKGIMDRVCREGDGLFPSPKEIKLFCSCPDGADMCKHVAAALYGVGARLDERPELLFVLRGVDEKELLASAGQDLVRTKAVPDTAKLLDDGDVAALFGLEMAESTAFDAHASPAPKRPRGSGTSRGNEGPVVTNVSAAKKSKPSPAARKKSGRKASSASTVKGGARRGS